MAPGVKPLRRLQFGPETTNGTAVTATARMRFNGGMLSDDREVTFPEELVGIMGGTDRAFTAKIAASLEIAETPITPEQLPYLLAMLYGGPKTGTADGSGSSGYKYVTTIPTTAQPTNNYSYTVEGGDSFEVERINYGKVTKLTLKGSAATGCTMSASMIGQQVARLGTSFTSTTIAAVNDLVFAGSRLYLDAVGGTIGTTAISNQFLGFEITLEGMWIPKYTGEGSTSGAVWGFVVYTGQKITGKITLENDTAADGSTGLKALFRALTPRLMRIDTLGDAYATAGTSTTFTGGRKGLRIDLPIKISKVPPIEDQDGNDTVTFEFESRYNATAATAGSITVCNEVSALP